jgi:hypothetical protein
MNHVVSGEMVVLVRFPSRLLVAGSVLGALVASSSAALTMPNRADERPLDVPEVVAGAGSAAPAPGAPAAAPIPTGPPVTGAELVALALAPARERANALIAEQQAEAAAAAAAAAAAGEAPPTAEAERAEDDDPLSGRDYDFGELRAELEEACDEGRVRGLVCQGD